MTPQFLLSESTVDVLAQVVLYFLWQGALLGLAAACLLHVSPIRTAHARYAFFCGLLTLLAICPLVTWRAVCPGGVTTIEIRESAGGGRVAARSATTDDNTAESSTMQKIAAQSKPAQTIAAPSMIGAPHWRLDVAGAWLAQHRAWIVAAWLVGICFMAARLLLGAVGVCILARRRKAVSPAVVHLVDRLSRQMKFVARPAVHVVERVSQATAVGILKPMVLLPASWASELPSEVLEAVIAHELAHLRRWDLPINFLQRVAETVLFFHPVVWWCSRRLRIEREMCCDELAQAAIGNRVVYAKALAYLAHQQCSSLESLLAAGIGGTKMVVFERICNVLGTSPGRRGRLYGPSCALVGAVVTSLVWSAVLGLPASWHPRTANTNDVAKLAAKEEPGTSPAAADSPLPTAAVEQSAPFDKVAQASQSQTLEHPEFKSRWDLTLGEAIKSAMGNAKIIWPLQERYTSAASDPFEAAAPARAKIGVSLADFEMGVLNLLNDTENAYWELAFAWRNLETSQTALESAHKTWKKVHLLSTEGIRGGEAKEEAQAREQFYQFKSQTQTLLNELLRAENRLRYVMGIAPADGRLICPIDEPTVAKVSFDWRETSEEAMARNPDLRRQKWRLKQRELEIVAANKLRQSRADHDSDSRLNVADGGQPEEASADNVGNPALLSGGGIRQDQLNLARERAKLQDEELSVSHQLATAMRQLELNYELTQTNFNRALAADRQVEAVQAAFDAETVTLDQLLEAQRRRAEAHTGYFRTLLDYQRAIIAVHLRKGSLL